MSQDPQSKPKSSQTASSSGLRGTGLKLVTIAASESMPDLSGFVPEIDPDEQAPPPPRVDPYIGCTIDNRYKVEAVLGEGGMGVVYRCRHKIIDKKVAMKILRADMARDKEVTERFLIEAKAASAIGNEHIIDISDFGQLPDGSTYFVMEYLDGQPLSQVVEGQQPVPVPRILHIARQLAEGLEAAHKVGIVHRDLKPDNIYLVPRGGEKDFVKILDFGIAKVSTGATGKLTRAGSVFGTPHYMSPEQAAGAPVDHRGDIYSFGVILYELACGRVPFDADNFMGILTQHMYKAPVPIRALVPPPQDIPPGLEAVVLKCLSKRPEQRYQSMQELAEELQKLAKGLVPEAVGEMMARSGGFNVPVDFFKKQGKMPAPVPATPAGLSDNRWPLVAGLAGVIVAVGLVIGIFVKSSSSPAQPSAEKPVAVTAAAAAPKPEPVVEPAEPSPSAEKAIAMTPVLIATEPLDARILKGDEELGSPAVVPVPVGEKVELVIEREGYVTQTVVLDGSSTKKTVRLTAAKAAATKRAPSHPAQHSKPQSKQPATQPKQGKPSIGGGEIVNPWSR